MVGYRELNAAQISNLRCEYFVKGVGMQLNAGINACTRWALLTAMGLLAACTNATQWEEEPLAPPAQSQNSADRYAERQPRQRPASPEVQPQSDRVYYPAPPQYPAEPALEEGQQYPAIYPDVAPADPAPQPAPAVRYAEPAQPIQPSGPASQNGAVLALLKQADQHHQQSNSEAAAVTLERALRIEPRNANLWYKLAAVRMEQGRLGEGEALAQKANSFATSDPYLRVASWRLIAEIRRRQGNAAGAQQADFQARELGNVYSP